MARKKPTFDAAPALVDRDFLAFERHKWSNSEFNPERLQLKRKLQAIGEPVAAHLKSVGGEALTLRTSIHNPYTFNGHRVKSLRFYLSPADKAKKPLRDLLGVEFASDTDASYVHANLVFRIDYEGVQLGLSVHERAWWDTQNVRNRCSTREGAEEFVEVLNGVQGGYALTMHDWKQRYPCGSLKWDDLLNFFRYFKPGEHRIQVTRTIDKGSEELRDPELYERVAAEFCLLLPAYRFILWSPENNFLGLKGS